MRTTRGFVRASRSAATRRRSRASATTTASVETRAVSSVGGVIVAGPVVAGFVVAEFVVAGPVVAGSVRPARTEGGLREKRAGSAAFGQPGPMGFGSVVLARPVAVALRRSR